MIRSVALLVSFSLLGCASAGSDTPAPIAGPERIVMAPLNVPLRMPVEVEGVEAPVWTALLDHFDRRGRSVRALDPGDARGLWTATWLDTGPGRTLRSATREFALRLAEHTDFDLLVLPSLVLRRAAVRGNHAHWDGVRRRVEIDRPWSGEIDGFGDPGVEARIDGLDGQLAGASLYVALLRPDGDTVYQGLGGLALLQEAEQAPHGPRGDWRVVLRDTPFDSAAQLSEGIAIALERPMPRTARAW